MTLPKISSLLLFLGLFYTATRCTGQVGIGSLHILPGTKWVSTPQTVVDLERMDLQYDADPILLNNVFRFSGLRLNTIRGESRPTIYAIGVAKGDPGRLTLNQAINVTGRINFESGYFNLNGNAIFMAPDAVLTNESEASSLVGPFGGYITITADLHAPVAANPGNLGAYITSATSLGKVTISRSHDPQQLNDSSLSAARWFNIQPPAGQTISAGLRFYYLSDEVEGLQPDSLVLWQGPDESPWAPIGFTTRDASQKYVEKQGLTSLGRFTLYPGPGSGGGSGSTTPPPPPGLMLLVGSWNKSLAQLDWTLTSEYQTDHFDVQRKYASESAFTSIVSIPTTAPGGASTTGTAYTYLDSTVKTGPDDVSYRINKITTASASTYSNIITLKAIGGSEFIKSCYPTIAIGGRVYIQTGNMPLDKMEFELLHSGGGLVMHGTLAYQSQWLPLTSLSHGIYRLVIRSGTHKFTTSIIR